MPKKTHSACNSIQNVSVHAIHHPSGASVTERSSSLSLLMLRMLNACWQMRSGMMEPAGGDLGINVANKAKGVAAWVMLAKDSCQIQV
jgi:hypothetical protein